MNVIDSFNFDVALFDIYLCAFWACDVIILPFGHKISLALQALGEIWQIGTIYNEISWSYKARHIFDFNA